MMMLCVLALAAFLVGAQIQLGELRLLTGRYRYQFQKPQLVTLLALLLGLLLIVSDAYGMKGSAAGVLAELLVLLLVSVMSEWLLARLSFVSVGATVVFRLLVVLGAALAVLAVFVHLSVSPFLLTGLYLRNCPFGVVHGKAFFLAYRLRRKGVEHVSGRSVQHSKAGEPMPVYRATDYGLEANTATDSLPALQALIDRVGESGGGCILLPKGRYLFNTSGRRQFLQVNHSHITLEGEIDNEGRLLTELVLCGPTVRGERNPWLSPFFITTGECLQPSNIFWGLDFRRPKHLRMESSSLSDPGSDGRILSPEPVTRLVQDALSGSSIIQVEDSSVIGRYILLCLYNTTADGNLIKELLGVDELRTEWATARRAGDEEAPSFQWLVEVRRVIDKHAVELCTPLYRDCLLKYEPVVCRVDMIEDVHLRNLCIGSRWNGLFHHHGFPFYYSVSQSQEMDYGWNAINLKRAAHSSIENVSLRNFTNPLYVQDSHQCMVENVSVSGYDGHQGLKVYCHTSQCVFRNIDFFCHYADMMGGEGNAYGNVFSGISYLNPTFHPVDFDFHGFSEGPMSPPAFNVFERISGFRYIKGAGAIYNQPACAVGNHWRDLQTEGERRGESLFLALSYREKSGLLKVATALGFTLVMVVKTRNRSFGFIRATFQGKLRDIARRNIPRKLHSQFFVGCQLENIQTTASYTA